MASPSILPKSRTFLRNRVSRPHSPARSPSSRSRLAGSTTLPERRRPERPLRDVTGVRSSWATEEMNSVFSRTSSSDFSREARS